MFVRRESDPPKVQQAPVKNSSTNLAFLKKLKLDGGTLERLAKISFLAENKLKNKDSSAPNSDLQVERKDVSEDDLDAEKVALLTLGIERLTKDPKVSAPIPSDELPLDDSFDEFNADTFIELKGEIYEFENDMQLLFADYPESLETIKNLTNEVRANYDKLFNASLARDDNDINAKADFQRAQVNIQKLQDQISSEITSLSTKPFIAAGKEVAAIGVIAAMVKSAKVRMLLNGASDTHQVVATLRGNIEEFSEDKTAVLLPEMRQELYGHIKVIQERTRDLMEIEKTRKRTFLSFFRNPSTKLQKEIEDLRKVTDQYYEQFNFQEDEVKEFHDLSIEAHLPKRQHLMMYVDDIVRGAQNEGLKCLDTQRDLLIREYLKIKHPESKEFLEQPHIVELFDHVDKRERLSEEYVRLERLGMQNSDTARTLQKEIKKEDQILSEKALDLMEHFNPESALEVNDLTPLAPLVNLSDILSQYTTIKKSKAHEFETMLKELKNLDPKALENFQRKNQILTDYFLRVADLHQKAGAHEHIGNNDRKENLSLERAVYKEQQKLAKVAIQGIFDELKVAYSDMTKGLDQGVDLTKAGGLLNAARNEVLNDHARWDKPIVRQIQFAAGPLASQAQKGNISVEHRMTCPNEGYPSSGFRDRLAVEDTRQPNLQRVTLTDSDGSIMAEYTSSATNVEFSLDGDLDVSDSRQKSTEHQTMEVLMRKVDQRWGNLSSEEQEQVGTQDNPLSIHVPVTLLLSPDTLRDWLMKNRELGKKIGHVIGGSMEVDSSKLERRILKESEAAWNSFDRTSELGKSGEGEDERSFTFLDKDGTKRTVFAHFDEEKQETYFTMAARDKEGNPIIDDEGKPKQIFVQFDVSCYDVGCNKWTKIMTNLKYGIGIEKAAKYAIAPFAALGIKWKGERITKYSGKSGNLKEDKMNKKAFEKDTVKYNNKLLEMDEKKETHLSSIYLGDYSFVNSANEDLVNNNLELIGILKEEIKETKEAVAELKNGRKLVKDEDELKAIDAEINQKLQNLSENENEVTQLNRSIRETTAADIKENLSEVEKFLGISEIKKEISTLKSKLEELDSKIATTEDEGSKVALSQEREEVIKEITTSREKLRKAESDDQILPLKQKLDQITKHQAIEQLIHGKDGIRELRKKFIEAERAYHSAKSPIKAKQLDRERKQAFKEWQAKKDELAKRLDLELNVTQKPPLSPELRETLEIIRHEENLRDTYDEVSDLFEFRDHRDPKYMKQNMYILPSAIVAFGCELEADPHTGCRSGKDRTSLQRMEVGTRFLLKKAYGRHLNYREQEEYPLTSQIREQMLLNSGHIDELAFLNIGSHGLNLSGAYGAYLKDFGKWGEVNRDWYGQVLEGAKGVFTMKLK